MFGTNSNSIFGSTGTSGGLFGSLQNQSQQPKPSLFGSAQPAQPVTGGLFGGQSASTSLFAQNSAQPQQQSGGLFGSQPTAVVGTTVKFVPVTATDTMLKGGTQSQINTKTMCITAMTEYQNKSVEELRLEDYIAGRKVGKPGTSSLFGQQSTAPAAGGGLFQQKDAQSTGGGMFGSLSAFATKPATTTQANTGFFSQKTGLFGNATSTAVSNSGGLFGTQAQNQPNKSLFQTPATQSGAGLFGSGTQTGGIFSQPAQPASQQPATGAFGSFGTTGQTTGFGGFKPTTTTQPSMFNTGQTGAFGQTAAPSTGTGFFGSGTAAVSQPTMFGQTSTQPATSSIFGPNAAVGGSSLFPNPNQQSSALPALGGGFGTQGGGLFQPVANVNNAAAVAAIAVPQLTTAVSLSSRARQEIIEAQLAALPYGDSPLLKSSNNKSVDSSSSASSPIDASVSRRSFPRFLATTSTTAASVSPIMSTIASQQSTTSTLSRPKPLPGSNTTLDTSSLMNSSFSYKPIISLPSAGFGTALGVSSSFSNSPNGTALKNRSYIVQDDEKSGTGGGNLTISSNASSRSLASRKIKALDVSVVQREGLNNSVLGVSFTDSTNQLSPLAEEPGHVEPSVARPPQQPIETPAARPPPVERDPVRRSIEERNRPIEINGSQSVEPPANRHQSPTCSPPQPALARAGATSPTADATTGNFICVPSVEELRSRMTHDGKYSIDEEGLTIARSGLGAVHWPGPFTISRLDFERIVVFRPREITVYAEDDANKPPVGEELNRLAEVTLENIWPLDKNKKPITKQQELIRLRFRERLISVCERMGAEFCDYNLLEGMWTFKVSHFSKYGYLDDDYDNETILAKMARMDDDEEYEAGKYYITQEELDGMF